MKRYLSVLAICLLATSLFAQPGPTSANTVVEQSSSSMPLCPYMTQSTLPVEPECLLCHPNGVPASNGGGGIAVSEITGFDSGASGEVMERVISGG